MIEKTVLDYLGGQITQPVYAETPNPVPVTEYVLIEKTGSSAEDRLTKSTLAIQSISTSMYKAAQLNETVIEKMRGLKTLNDVSRVELETDYNFTNTATKQYRYQAVFNITHY